MCMSLECVSYYFNEQFKQGLNYCVVNNIYKIEDL